MLSRRCSRLAAGAGAVLATYTALAQSPEPVAWVGLQLNDPPGLTLGSLSWSSISRDGTFALESAIQQSGTALVTFDNQGIRAIARNGSQAPGAAPGQVFGPFQSDRLTLRDGEFIGFEQFLSGPGVTAANSKGLWGFSGNQFSLIARLGDEAAELRPGDTFSRFDPPVLAGLQRIAWVAQVNETGAPSNHRTGLWVGGMLGRQIVAAEANIAPGTPNEPFTFFPDPSQSIRTRIGASPQGAVVFTAQSRMADTGVRWGLWQHTPSTGLTPVALQMVTTPQGLDPRITIGQPGQPAVSDNGTVAFRSFLFSPSGSGAPLSETNDTAMLASSGGTLRVVAREGQAAPGRPDLGTIAPFTGSSVDNNHFKDPSINSSGAIAFGAETRQGTVDKWGVFFDWGHGLQTLMGTGDVATNRSGVAFSSAFYSVTINDFNDVAVLGGGTANQAIFVSVGASTLWLIAQVGDTVTLPTGQKQILRFVSASSISAPTPAWGDDRNLYFYAQFTDQSTALLRSHVPAPGGALAVILAGGAVLGRRQRRPAR